MARPMMRIALPLALEEVIATAIEKDPQRRQPSALELAMALEDQLPAGRMVLSASEQLKSHGTLVAFGEPHALRAL